MKICLKELEALVGPCRLVKAQALAVPEIFLTLIHENTSMYVVSWAADDKPHLTSTSLEAMCLRLALMITDPEHKSKQKSYNMTGMPSKGVNDDEFA